MPTMEYNINWSVFDAHQKKMLENALENGHYEQLAAILYEVSPEQAIEINKIQRQFRPREFKFESQVQQEFEIWSTANFNDVTPEKVAEWQQKIKAEKQERLASLNNGMVETKVEQKDGSKEFTGTISNQLKDVVGLGEVSIKKLNASNIYSVDELRKLSKEERVRILGPLVASKITTLI